MKYIGIDLHSNNAVVAVLDEHERVLYRKRHRNQLDEIVAAIKTQVGADESRSAVESTYNWYWLVDGLIERGFDVRLANSAALPVESGLKHSDDETDAIRIARLLARGQLPQAYCYPVKERAWRDLLRKRMQLVQLRARQLTAIDHLLSCHTGASMSTAARKRMVVDDIAALPLAPVVKVQLGAHVRLREAFDQEIEAIEEQLNEHLQTLPTVALLKSVPGIGVILSATIALEIGDIARFASAGKFASYCRLVDSKRVSNGKLKGRGNAKCGNRYLSWAFMEAATFATRWLPQAQRFYSRKSTRAHKFVALKALAHKLARACYQMLKHGTTFDPARCFA